MGWNDTYLHGLEMSGEVEQTFMDVYARLTPQLRLELAHSPQGKYRISKSKTHAYRVAQSNRCSFLFLKTLFFKTFSYKKVGSYKS